MQTVYLSDTSNPIAVAVAKFVKKGLTFYNACLAVSPIDGYTVRGVADGEATFINSQNGIILKPKQPDVKLDNEWELIDDEPIIPANSSPKGIDYVFFERKNLILTSIIAALGVVGVVILKRKKII